MSGHSKWSQIKHKKEVTDKKRAKFFTKLLGNIQVAAKDDPNPEFNPRLRDAVLKAKEANIPQENIDRAIKRAKEEPSEEILVEMYGPEGSAFMVAGVTANTNRTMADIKAVAKDFDAKIGLPGSAKWAFNQSDGEFVPNFTQAVSEENREKISNLIDALEDIDEVTAIYTNAVL
ncbi:MAG: YebC/PmpR family DNA-binding transcriptional regulator [Patescibacteria group bacterium]|nr:YebC/PmpR family DNA-binding transcriptional regulator [Patescibacteria group bacterium]MCL5262169.1 YebC/PmpR family DNA-binding transcriptional regulator [Patescibacteria group bacterium]